MPPGRVSLSISCAHHMYSVFGKYQMPFFIPFLRGSPAPAYHLTHTHTKSNVDYLVRSNPELYVHRLRGCLGASSHHRTGNIARARKGLHCTSPFLSFQPSQLIISSQLLRPQDRTYNAAQACAFYLGTTSRHFATSQVPTPELRARHDTGPGVHRKGTASQRERTAAHVRA